MSEQCSTCPNRFEAKGFDYPTSRLRNPDDIAGCPGAVTILRGFIASHQRHDDEPIPKGAISAFGKTMYFMPPVWRLEVACGQDEIKPGENEAYFDPERPFELDAEGRPYYVFVSYNDSAALTILHAIRSFRPHTHEPSGDDLTG